MDPRDTFLVMLACRLHFYGVPGTMSLCLKRPARRLCHMIHLALLWFFIVMCPYEIVFIGRALRPCQDPGRLISKIVQGACVYHFRRCWCMPF